MQDLLLTETDYSLLRKTKYQETEISNANVNHLNNDDHSHGSDSFIKFKTKHKVRKYSDLNPKLFNNSFPNLKALEPNTFSGNPHTEKKSLSQKTFRPNKSTKENMLISKNYFTVNYDNPKLNKNKLSNTYMNDINYRDHSDDENNKNFAISCLQSEDIIIEHDNSSSNYSDVKKPENPEKLTCKICLETNSKETEIEEEKFISPCLCHGTMKWVHESCLKKWIPSQFKKIGKAECEICKYKYKIMFITNDVFSSEKMCNFVERFFTFLGILCLFLFLFDLVIYSIIVNVAKFSEAHKQTLFLVLSLSWVGILLIFMVIMLSQARNRIYEKIPINWSILDYNSEFSEETKSTYEMFKKMNLKLENSNYHAYQGENNMDINDSNRNFNDNFINRNEINILDEENNIRNFDPNPNLQNFINEIDHISNVEYFQEFRNNYLYTCYYQDQIRIENRNNRQYNIQQNLNIEMEENRRDLTQYNADDLAINNNGNLNFIQDEKEKK